MAGYCSPDSPKNEKLRTLQEICLPGTKSSFTHSKVVKFGLCRRHAWESWLFILQAAYLPHQGWLIRRERYASASHSPFVGGQKGGKLPVTGPTCIHTCPLLSKSDKGGFHFFSGCAELLNC